MTPEEFQQLKDKARTGGLSTDERAVLRGYLAAHPAAAADWEDDDALDRGLAALPDVPVSPDFNARVMAEVRREAGHRSTAPVQSVGTRSNVVRFPGFSRMLNPLAAAAVVALLIGGSALVWRQQRDLRHAAMAESLAKFSDTTAVPGVEVLRDFAAIQRLSQTLVSGDEELAAALAGGEQ